MRNVLLFVLIFTLSCSVKKDIEYTPIEINLKKDSVKTIPVDTVKKEQEQIPKKIIPTPPPQRQYKYMKRIIHRNNPVA